MVASANDSKHNEGVPRSDEFNQEDPLLAPTPLTAGTALDAAVSAPLSAGAEAMTSTTEQWRKEFDFPGVLDLVPDSREQVMEFVCRYCSDEGDQIDILVAVQEALANAALHGCHDDPEKRIHCVVTADANEITIAVRDPGPGFDLSLADPEKYQVTKRRHGRGICLMRSLMSEVTFAHNGSEVVMRKRLHAAL